jgi:hypothetical protein
VSDSLDAYVDASATVLRLPLEDAWKPGVRVLLEIALDFARDVDEFSLPDEIEPADVFAA